MNECIPNNRVYANKATKNRNNSINTPQQTKQKNLVMKYYYDGKSK